MIDDGYTQRWSGFLYRPLPEVTCIHVLSLIDQKQWSVVKHILWDSSLVCPHPKTDRDKKELFDRMVSAGSKLPDNQANLSAALELMLRNPLLAKRTCSLCKVWWFDQDTNLIVQHEGQSLKRIPLAQLPCETSGCEKGHHSNPLELSEINKQVWEHYCEYRNVGLPDSHRQCPTVRSNWNIIEGLVAKYGSAAIHS